MNKVLVSELCEQRGHSETNLCSVVYTPKPIVQVLYNINHMLSRVIVVITVKLHSVKFIRTIT